MNERTHIDPPAQDPAPLPVASLPPTEVTPVSICLLGAFRVLRTGGAAPIPVCGKAAALLSLLALRRFLPVPRAEILSLIWPDRAPDLAIMCLHTLLHDLRTRLRLPTLVVYARGTYALNIRAGILVDVYCFDQTLDQAEQHYAAGDFQSARRAYCDALTIYQGDLCAAACDPSAPAERARLRARYLNLLFYTARDYHDRGNNRSALEYLHTLLARDPCREDAHRIAMRCYQRQGQRAQALRQYQQCEQALRPTFGAVPEPATTALYDQLRFHPGAV